MAYINHKRVKKLNTGGQIGNALGAGATSFIPGVGPALAPIGGMIGGKIGSMFSRNKEQKNIVMGSGSYGYKYGGKMKKYPMGGQIPIGAGAMKYHGPQHEDGGIPIDAQGNPNQSNPVAEVEGGETRQGDFIFSDELMVPESDMTFAQMHEMLLQEGAGEEQIEQLAQLQEQVKQEQGIPDDGGSAQSWGEQGFFKTGGKLKKYPHGGQIMVTAQRDPFKRSVETPTMSSAPTARPMSTVNSPEMPDLSYDANNPLHHTTKPTRFGRAMSSIESQMTTENAQRYLPSAMKLGVAAFAPKPEDNPRVQARKVSERNPAFAEGRRQMAGAFRANPTQGGHAQYTTGMNQLSASEAQDRLGREQFNAQSQMRADQMNQRAGMMNNDARARDTASRMRLITEAIQLPLDMAAADKAGLQQQIAQILISRDQIANVADWERRMSTNLAALGLDESEIAKLINQFKPQG